MTPQSFCGTLHFRSFGEFFSAPLSLVLISQIGHFSLLSRFFSRCSRTVIKSSVLVYFLPWYKHIVICIQTSINDKIDIFGCSLACNWINVPFGIVSVFREHPPRMKDYLFSFVIFFHTNTRFSIFLLEFTAFFFFSFFALDFFSFGIRSFFYFV